MNILFLIPARAGSVRLKNKNIRNFLGKELFLHTVNFANIASKQLTNHSCKVCLSTDDSHILEYEKLLSHIDFFHREVSLSSSTASLEDVCDSVLAIYAQKNIYFDLVCLLQVTSPLRDRFLFNKALNNLASNSNSNGVIELEEHKQHLGEIEDNLWKPYNNSDIQSQSLSSLYKPSGRLFLYKVNKQCTIFRDKLSAMIIKPDHVNNIDTLDDFIVAEFKANQITDFDYLFSE